MRLPLESLAEVQFGLPVIAALERSGARREELFKEFGRPQAAERGRDKTARGVRRLFVC